MAQILILSEQTVKMIRPPLEDSPEVILEIKKKCRGVNLKLKFNK